MTSGQTFERIRAIIYELKRSGGDETLDTESFARQCQESLLEAADLLDTLGPMVEQPAVFEIHLNANEVIYLVGPGSAVQNCVRAICTARDIIAVTKLARYAAEEEVRRYFVEGVFVLPSATRE